MCRCVFITAAASSSAGYAVSRTYLETLADLPWNAFAARWPRAQQGSNVTTKPAGPSKGGRESADSAAAETADDGQQGSSSEGDIGAESSGPTGIPSSAPEVKGKLLPAVKEAPQCQAVGRAVREGVLGLRSVVLCHLRRPPCGTLQRLVWRRRAPFWTSTTTAWIRYCGFQAAMYLSASRKASR